MSPLKIKIISVGLILVCFWLVLLVTGAQIRFINGRRQLDAMNDRMAGSQRENDRLARELELMKQPDWLALLARERLNYKRPDETVVFVYKAEKSGTIAPPHQSQDSRPNWRRWLDWLAGR